MRITGWRIDGFGIFTDTKVQDLPSGLTIISGPNEAGKSTLLGFLRGVLFGFPDGRMRARRYVPLYGGRHGGAVMLQGSTEGTWTVERHADPKSFVLRRPDGSLAEDHELRDLLGGADATLFSNVFAFGLAELDAFKLLESDAVRDRVFSAGVVGAGRSARQALATLDARRNALLRPRGKCDIRERAEETRRVAQELAQAQAAATDLVRRRDDVERLAALADRRRQAVDDSRQQQRRFRTLVEMWPIRNRLAEIEDEIAELEAHGIPKGIDDGFELRFERLQAEEAAAVAALEEAELELAAAIERRDSITIDEALGSLGPEIRALGPEVPAEEARSARLVELQREITVHETALAEQLTRLGTGWDRDQLARFDVSIPAADEVRQRGERLTTAEDLRDRTQNEYDSLAQAEREADQELTRLQEELDELASAPSSEEVAGRSRALRLLRANLVDLGTESARLEGAERTLAHLRAATEDQSRTTGAPSRGVLALGVGVALAVAAGAAVVAGWNPGAMVAGALALAAVVVGVALLTIEAPPAVPADAPTTGEERAAERTRDDARARVVGLRTSVEAVATVLGLPIEPTAMDVEECASAVDEAAGQAQRRNELLGQLRLVKAERREAVDRRRDLEHRLVELTGRVDEERARWREWKTQHGVPPELGVSGINDLFTAVDRARGALRSLQAAEDEHRKLRAASESWRTRASALRAQIDPQASDEDLLPALRTLVERAEIDTDARRTLADRTGAVTEAEQRCEGAVDRVAVVRAARDELFSTAEVNDEAELRRTLQRRREHRELTIEHDRAVERIHDSVGWGGTAAELWDELDRGDPAYWAAQLEDVTRTIPDLEAQHEDAIRMHHDASRQLDELSSSADVADAALRLETARTRLGDAVAEWQTLSAAHRLISGTLARYERERQPAVLARAEKMFSEVTEGHHVGLSVVDGEMSIIDRSGRRLTTDDLSRGTAEQLYLCLRFGLAAEMATHTPLPFVMDDVLVNFDPVRTEVMARVISEIAAEHQVLLFTCQPATVEALVQADPEAHLIELPRHGGR